jgi:hypothetical protein
MKRYNISKPEKYIKDGVEKTAWKNVGTMTEFSRDDGSVSRIVEIPAIGLKANVFEQTDPADQTPRPQKSSPMKPAVVPAGKPKDPDQIEYPTEDINPDDIPF